MDCWWCRLIRPASGLRSQPPPSAATRRRWIEARSHPRMHFMDIFVGRPGHRDRRQSGIDACGIAGDLGAADPAVPADGGLIHLHHDGLRRCLGRSHPWLRHHPCRARRLVHLGHRLCQIDQRRRAQHRHGAPEAEPFEHGRAGRSGQPARSDPERAADGSGILLSSMSNARTVLTRPSTSARHRRP